MIFLHRLFLMADGLYDYLPLSVMCKIKLNFCTQQETDREDRYISQIILKEFKIYKYYILTFFDAGIMISNIVYFNTTNNSGK